MVSITRAHLSGLSFRTLGYQTKRGTATIYRASREVIKNLPHCADVTRKYCTRFCGILVVDGKYVKVKGFERKIPVIYGIDYLTHDIPTYVLSLGENYQTCLKFFQSLKLLKYPLQAIIADDNVNIFQAALNVYPDTVIQLCHNHYKENIRATLSVRTDETYGPFMGEIEELFAERYSKEQFDMMAGKIFHRYQGPRCQAIMLDIEKRKRELTGYMQAKRIPRTTNLIESYNSHLQGRLKTIKGFKSFKSADSWLNAYFLKRRLTPFTDCTKKFKSLNGHCSLEFTLQDKAKLPILLKLLR